MSSTMAFRKEPNLWKSFVPTKASFFAWEAWHGKILTVEKIQKEGLH